MVTVIVKAEDKEVLVRVHSCGERTGTVVRQGEVLAFTTEGVASVEIEQLEYLEGIRSAGGQVAIDADLVTVSSKTLGGTT